VTFTVEPMVTEYRLSILPDGHVDAEVFAVYVGWRGDGKWGVFCLGSCYSADGQWDQEPSPSNRSDEWLAAHRFPLDEALALAQRVLPTVSWNGWTAEQILAKGAQ
jgi:hypothetical protein